MDINQNIISLLDIGSLPDERKAAIIEQATVLVQKSLLLRFMESLDETKKAEFNKLLDQGDDKQITAFIEANIPNLGKWIEEETLKVKQDLISNLPPDKQS